jgi:hypothetical protein
MNSVLVIGFIAAVIIGWIRGGQEMERAKYDPRIGIKPSKNLISFLFLDY